MAIKTRRFISANKSCSCSMPGVWRAVAYTDGVVVIFHSPRACGHVARTMDINAQYGLLAAGLREVRRPVPLLCTQLEEKDAIFGGIERLERCLEFAVRQYQPQCLVIANSCVAGVIGDDVLATAEEAEERYGIPVLTVDCCGFLDGEYYGGYFAIARQLLERFAKPLAHEPRTVLLLGDNGGPWGSYASEVSRLLAGMGVRVRGQFPGYIPFAELPELAGAEAAIILGGRGQTHTGLTQLAQYLQEHFGINYLSDIYPIGWPDTQRWLLAVGELLGVQEQARQVLAQERAYLERELQQMLLVTRGRKTALCIGRWLFFFHPQAILQTIKLLELDLTAIVLLAAYEGDEKEKMAAVLRELSPTPIYELAEGEQYLRAADVVLTTHELQQQEIRQVFLPMINMAGTEGELAMLRGIYRCLCSRLEGGLFYV